MTNEEKEIAIKELLKDECLTCLKVDNVNHKPHIFMITEKHIANSKGMYLEANSAPCGMPNCRLSYEEHTSDNVAFLQAVKDCTNQEVNVVLNKIVEKFGEKFLDGFAFVESDFKIT